MVDNPISNPGVGRPEPIPPNVPKPNLGADEASQGQKQFTFGPEGQKINVETQSTYPSPMEVAGDAARQQAPLAPEELSDQIVKLQSDLSSAQNKLQDPQVTDNLISEHYNALQKLTQKMNPDMQTIAKNSSGHFELLQQTSSQSMGEYVAQWLNGAQGTLGGALNYLQNLEKPDITSYFKLQYAVQRATQRGELFATIIGSSVSGIKTIMSTQLG
jgi:hypothetical protein